MKQVRISGIVALANRARRELAAGLAPAARDQLRARVQGALSQAQSILVEHQAGREHLPAPTRRALQFLQQIPWDQLPVAASSHRRPDLVATGTFSFTGLAAAANRALRQLATGPGPAELDAIARSIATSSRRLEFHVQHRGLEPRQLSASTRDWRGWLACFSDRGNLDAYCQALQRASVPLSAAAARRKYRPPLRIEFRPGHHLYRITSSPGGSLAMLPTPMISFDQDAFANLGDLIATGSRHARQRVIAAMSSRDYQNIRAQLEALGGIPEESRGACHDLADAFERVNRQYFDGRLQRPRLTWSRTFTGWKFGHYDSIRDMVMVSATLDQPHVPAFVVDFLLYHELLHKDLGVKMIDGRRYAHTPEFRTRERAFGQYEQAEAMLKALARDGGVA